MIHKLALTVDVEDWYHIPSVTGSPFSVYPDVGAFFKSWKGRYDYLTEPTIRVLDIFDRYDVKGTFFVVADVVEYYPGLVEKIVERGHEIGCHGLHHECYIDPKTKAPLFDVEEFTKRTREAKSLLEEVSGQKVIGYRAPNALIGSWMLKELPKIGFRYDSSVSANSFISKTDMEHGFSSKPMIVNEDGFTEFPFPYWEVWSIKIPTSGGPYLRFLGSRIILKGLIQSLERGSTTFYFHPIDISGEDFPRVGRGRPFYWSIKGKVVEKRLNYVLRQLLRMGVEFDKLSNIRDDIEAINL